MNNNTVVVLFKYKTQYIKHTMSKTYRRDKQFRPKKRGQVFTKEQPWKKDKQRSNSNDPNKDKDVYLDQE